MDNMFANLEDTEIYFKAPAELEVRPIEDKIFKDGIKEILSVNYD